MFRAKLILMPAEGSSCNAIKQQLQTTAPTIVRWKQHFRQHGLEGLDTYHPGQKPSVLTPALHARIPSATRRKPSDGSTHWSCRKLASALGVSKDAVHRVWQDLRDHPKHSPEFLSRLYHSNPIFTPASNSETPPRNKQIIENKWRKRVGVERAKALITKEILWNQSGFPIKTLTSAGG